MKKKGYWTRVINVTLMVALNLYWELCISKIGVKRLNKRLKDATKYNRSDNLNMLSLNKIIFLIPSLLRMK